MKIKAVINAIAIWLNPQIGLISALQRQNHSQACLIKTLKERVRSETLENEKLWENIAKLKNGGV